MAIPDEFFRTGLGGLWAGVNRLHDPHAGVPVESRGTALLMAVLGGRFARLDYTWAHRGEPQEGSLLLGGGAAGAMTGHWIDSWHMGELVMALRGTAAADGSISLRGSYAAPPGRDWGWRIDLLPTMDQLRMDMFNITPDGHEELAVEATYTLV